MDYKFLISVLLTFFVCSCEERALPAYLDVSKPVEDRVEDALSRMTKEEKVARKEREILEKYGLENLTDPQDIESVKKI